MLSDEALQRAKAAQHDHQSPPVRNRVARRSRPRTGEEASSSVGSSLCHDVVTVVYDPKHDLGKQFKRKSDGTVEKKSSVTVGFALARQHRVPDAESMASLVLKVSKNPRAAIINASFLGIPLDERFVILSEEQIRERLGLTTREEQIGVHEIEHEGKTLKAVTRFKENVAHSSWVLLDRDTDQHTPARYAGYALDQWIAALDQMFPGLRSATMVCTQSTSSRVLCDGEPVGSGNGHVWIQVRDPQDITRFRLAILPRAVELAMTWLKPRHSRTTEAVVGYSLTTILDTSVLNVGRLVFCGKPVVGSGLEVIDPQIEILNPHGGRFDTTKIELPPADQYARVMQGAGVKMQLRGDGASAAVDVYDLFYDTELELQDGRLCTVRELVEQMTSGDKVRCQAPSRDSDSFAAFLRTGKDGRPCVHDSGTGITHWLCDEEWTQSVADEFDVLPEPPTPMATPRSALEILNTTFKPIMWTILNLLLEGLFLLVASPKVGKSWFSLQIALAVASGGVVLGEQAKEGDVLVLALEDSDRRLQSRLNKLDANELPRDALARLQFETEWPRIGQGGGERIVEWLDQHPKARLVVVDVLERIRPPRNPKANAYAEDYAALKELKRIADQRQITILVVHHTRKAAADDAMHMISGTQGLAGAADGSLVLERPRGESRGKLHIMARDLEREGAFVVEFDGGRWSMVGSASAVASTEGQQQILNVLRARGEAMGPTDIAGEIEGGDRRAVHRMLVRMVRDGLVRREGNGKYAIAEDLDDLTAVTAEDLI